MGTKTKLDGKTFTTVRIASWDDTVKDVKITVQDVVEYYRTQACNITSGIRMIAGEAGDWRPIDNIARYCLEYFKGTCIDTLRREARKAGLEPRF